MVTATTGFESVHTQFNGRENRYHAICMSCLFSDASHLPALLRAHVGDIVRLRSDVYKQTVLYQVQEVYRGGTIDMNDAEFPRCRGAEYSSGEGKA